MIDDVRPRSPTGAYPAKAVVGEAVRVSADVYRDGHDRLAAQVRLRPVGGAWAAAPMRAVGNDRWEAVVRPGALGPHELVVEAWTDALATWATKVQAKLAAGQDVDVELEEAARLLGAKAAARRGAAARRLREVAAHLRQPGLPPDERARPALDPEVAALAYGPGPGERPTRAASRLWVDRERALVGAWYELFPRSEGGLRGTAKRLEAVAAMGFDVVYLPPIHPVGTTNRKGRDNSLAPAASDPGSPWAIGSPDGGHTAVAPELGTLADFDALVARAGELGLEVALDYALQCSPDHPWVSEHPEWFHSRPDGSIAYAENPPKKYQDIYPLDFWPAAEASRRALWDACKGILDFWVARGVRTFRVDNPHTKPFAFWEWVIPAVQADHPDVVFLAEAFTRPKVMRKLAEIGFSQSYTYFTWRTGRDELEEYLRELTGDVADVMRPSFWPNTPDILSGPLRHGPPAAFKLRLVLAATMVPTYGIYSGYELGENEPASEANEEYLHSEKFEVKSRDWASPTSLAPFVALLNGVRRRHPVFSRLRNLSFQGCTNDRMIAYAKVSEDGTDVVLVVVNLDPWHPQEATLYLDLPALGLPDDAPYEAHDELTGRTFSWYGRSPYVKLDPAAEPAHVLHLRRPGAPG